jgi:hypothetical protein
VIHSSGCVAASIPAGDAGLIDSFSITCAANAPDFKTTRVGASLGSVSFGTFAGDSFVIGDGTTISTDGTIAVFGAGTQFVDVLTTAASPNNQFDIILTTDQESLPATINAANYFNRIVLENVTQSVTNTLNFSDITFTGTISQSGGNESIQFIYRPSGSGVDVGWSSGDVINIQLRSD